MNRIEDVDQPRITYSFVNDVHKLYKKILITYILYWEQKFRMKLLSWMMLERLF